MNTSLVCRKTLCCIVAGVVPSSTMATYSAYEHFGWLARVAPAFRVDGDKVEVLQDPAQFYERLKVCISMYPRIKHINIVSIET